MTNDQGQQITGWACLTCGAVYSTKQERDKCEQHHGDEEEAFEADLYNILDPNQ